MTLPGKREVFFLFVTAGAAALSLLRAFPVVGPVISFSLAGIVVYLMQFKSWAYQDIPVLAGGFMLCGALLGVFVTWLVGRLKDRQSVSSVAAYSLCVVVAGMCCVSASEEMAQVGSMPRFDMAQLGYSGSAPMMDVDTPFTDIIMHNSRPRDPILFISNAVAPGFPIMMQLRRTPASRHLHECILSVLQFMRSDSVKDAETKRLMAYEPVVIEGLGEDILKNKPLLIFLQDNPIKNDYLLPYDFVHKYLSDYYEISNINDFTVYKLDPLKHTAPAPDQRGKP
jgi:hypothetical protein